MCTGSYRFPLGEFECVSLSDGSLDYPLKSFFANVPLEQVEEALRRRDLPTDYITTPYTYLYVDTGAHRVLVDMGAGHLGPRTGKLVENMQAAGIRQIHVPYLQLFRHVLPPEGRLRSTNALSGSGHRMGGDDAGRGTHDHLLCPCPQFRQAIQPRFTPLSLELCSCAAHISLPSLMTPVSQIFATSRVSFVR